MNKTNLVYMRYLNGYVQTRKPEQITWIDVYKTLFLLGKINIKVLAFNLKAMIQNCSHMDFGVFLPSDLETFLRITRMLKNARNRHELSRMRC